MINLRFIIFVLLSHLNTITLAQYADKPAGYAVASAHPLATQAGLEILAKGGNAFDAAVAVSAVLAVVSPYHSGLGGGGFWLLHLAKDKKNVFIDGRETAPMAAHKNMFLDKEGKLVPYLSLNGGLAAAIPGEPAALVFLSERYGRFSLAKSLAPAIRLAEDGFLVDSQFNYYSRIGDRLQVLARYPHTAAVFLKEDRAYNVGERLKQPDLAKTLRLLAQKGHQGFYHGEVAERLVKGVNAAGGVWSTQDLASYKIKVREPLQGAFHNMLIVSAPPPSAGGVGLITMLNILADYPLRSLPKAKWMHYVIESMRLAYWQRSKYLADPDFVKIPLELLISAANARHLRQHILPDKAISSSTLQGEPANSESKNTTQIAILDSEGNRVSATMTVNYIFGSGVVPEGTGVLLNDEMDDFSTKPGERNVYDIVGSNSNIIQPGKRPLSSMTPTFLEMPGRLAIVGTPGGSRIPTMVLLASLAFYDYKGAITMVSKMRFHHQYLPDWVQVEPETFSPALQADLKAMGYNLMLLKQYYGDMQAISWDKKENIITAASDPRHIGLATVIALNNQGYDSFKQ